MSKENKVIEMEANNIEEEVIESKIIEDEEIEEESGFKKFWKKFKKPALIGAGLIAGGVILGKIKANKNHEPDLFNPDDDFDYYDTEEKSTEEK